MIETSVFVDAVNQLDERKERWTNSIMPRLFMVEPSEDAETAAWQFVEAQADVANAAAITDADATLDFAEKRAAARAGAQATAEDSQN